MRVSVVGLGYVGLVTAASLAEWGNQVVGIEASEARLSALRDGRMPIFEPGLDEVVQRNRESGRLQFAGPDAMSRAVHRADIVMVAVGTHDGHGGWQTDTISSTLDALVPMLGAGTTLVVRSTLPPEYVASLASYVEARAGENSGPVPTILNPEFMREGSALHDFMQPDRVVIGLVSDETGLGQRALAELYAPSSAPMVVLPALDASVGKLAANLFLATKISFANELAGICDSYGATIDNVVASMTYDKRIGTGFLRPGVGFGGSCLPHQVAMTLLDAQSREVHAPLLAAVKQINEFQPRRVLLALNRMLSGLHDARVALLGLTFKPDTDDLREAPSLRIAQHLLDAGARVVAYDPMPAARSSAVEQVPGLDVAESPMAAMRDAHAVVLATEWSVFRELDWLAAANIVRNPLMVDGRGALDAAAMTEAGWTYHAFGRGTHQPVTRSESVMVNVQNASAAIAHAEGALDGGHTR
ncbi:MAG: UDP-glucose/GDP-mannose dehydrogenase family protein [Chloroflexi bacterium]|nr:UDP-glucose/GDP-mannose dehydrogenase family protein [Chloroflexota bacterium]